MHLGKYRLIRPLAVGGMAEVHLAAATGIEGFEKLVVIKRILPQFAQNRTFVSMFLDEARLAATLHHPSVVQVFDIGTEDGYYYFAMEYVQGEDVRQILTRAQKLKKPVPLGCAVAVVLDMCRALHYAHERRDATGRSLGIVHRDVTPANVIVTREGTAKLLDFGVAKAASHHTETVAGSLKGKISYMSPEQCRGESLDRRSDVFALGILAFEMTTGSKLFRGESDLATLNRIASQDVPSPRTRRPDYPAALEQVVMRALARDRDARYPTAMALQRDLEAFAREERLSTSTIDVADFFCELFPAAALAPPVELAAASGTAVMSAAATHEAAAAARAASVPALPLARPALAPPPNSTTVAARPVTVSRVASGPPRIPDNASAAPARRPASAPPVPSAALAKRPSSAPPLPAPAPPVLPEGALAAAAAADANRASLRRDDEPSVLVVDFIEDDDDDGAPAPPLPPAAEVLAALPAGTPGAVAVVPFKRAATPTPTARMATIRATSSRAATPTPTGRMTTVSTESAVAPVSGVGLGVAVARRGRTRWLVMAAAVLLAASVVVGVALSRRGGGASSESLQPSAVPVAPVEPPAATATVTPAATDTPAASTPARAPAASVPAPAAPAPAPRSVAAEPEPAPPPAAAESADAPAEAETDPERRGKKPRRGADAPSAKPPASADPNWDPDSPVLPGL